MAQALAVSDLVNVSINLSPLAAGYANFGALLMAGDSDVIDTVQRTRQYSSLTEVVNDFGSTAPEYLAADLFFSQSPQPNNVYIGRWARTATHGRLNGAILTPTQASLTNFTTITTGSFSVTIDGTVEPITGLNFSAALNMNGVASIIQTALDVVKVGSTVVWDSVNSRFIFKSGTTGISSSVSYLSPEGTGTDISTLVGGTAASGAGAPIVGIVAETALSAVSTLDSVNAQWYGLMFASVVPPADTDYEAVAGYIEGAGRSHIFGVTTQETSVLDPTQSTDIASLLQALTYKRTFVQYSSSSPYAAASMFGRAFTVNFMANDTTITLMYKQEPGIVAENLTETQAATAHAKNANVFAAYNNSTAIIQFGTMANGYYFDEVHGTDWLQNQIQVDVFNLLYQTPTKVPQTDAGTHLIVTIVKNSCVRAVNNGLVAPGIWNVAGFGQLSQGDMLTTGFYVYAPPVASQSQADREARKSVPIQVAVKLAGAVHTVNVIVNVNR